MTKICEEWFDIKDAPRGEVLFLLKHPIKHTVVEAAFFLEYADSCDGQPVGAPLWNLHDMTNDKPIEDWYDDYTWQARPKVKIDAVS